MFDEPYESAEEGASEMGSTWMYGMAVVLGAQIVALVIRTCRRGWGPKGKKR